MEGKNSEKSSQALREEAVLRFWQENNIFEKTLEKDSPKGEYVFYEGPPTANAKPALHHLEARAFKDVIPRYKTMQGFHVPRRAGWDTHGLPVELQIEKKLGLASKKDIESYGVAAFNKECKDSVFTYIKDWEDFSDRIGYWVDKKNAYYTFNNNYIESLWNIVGEVNKKGLLYKDYKVVPWCPRCGTGLSTHELGQPGAYVDVKDLTVYAKFKIVGFENAYFVAWTTTPWTLPGNVALAVGADIDYVEAKNGEEILVIAKDRLNILESDYEIIAEHKGTEMAGMEYVPLYPSAKVENTYKIHTADFVDTETGTGIVHIAPMYGVDDFELGTKNNLPKIHSVDESGHFINGLAPEFLEGRFVKDEEVAVDIIKDLAHRGLLFKKEKYEHPYPHCWRCKTPLLYYARDSWYIAMSKIRDDLVNANKNINWEPNHIKEGRFGEWLENIRDWAISRERYWGTPLPVWTPSAGSGQEIVVVNSIETLKSFSKKSGNKYFVMRHGQTENNLKKIWCCDSNTIDPLTDLGIEQVKNGVSELGQIDMIISSPFPRTKQSAKLAAEILGITEDKIISDPRLGEWNIGKEYDGKPLDDFFAIRNSSDDRYNFKFDDAESYIDVLKRVSEFMYDIESKYQDKNILIITHGAPSRDIELAAEGFSFKSLFEQTRKYENFNNGEIRQIDFVPLPHNENFELDLHKPYIDEVKLVTKDGKDLVRVKEVMDVWFDSGGMPFAQDHYPFSKNELHFPADFISEAIDQTRGWFYTMHAIGVLMDRGNAYKNVICLGHLLDANGKKMSKSLGNIVDPVEQINMYGVDTLRFWMYSVTQPGDSKNYDEKIVKEMQNKIFGLLYNVISFYDLYRDPNLVVGLPSENVLDQWMMARLNQFISLATEGLDSYKIFEPARGFRDLIDDLSTWYLRRSRDRIKDGDLDAKQTLYVVLKTISKLLAPFAPFAAEDIWQKLKVEGDEESVHLSSWPESNEIDEKIISEMEVVRNICTLGNALRKKSGVPVRQPLSNLKVKSLNLSDEYLDLIKDELNVKEVVEDENLTEEAELDLIITPELKKEGDYRELVRAVQDMRKEAGLEPSDFVMLTISPEAKNFLENFIDDFKKTVQATEVKFEENNGREAKIDEMILKIKIEK